MKKVLVIALLFGFTFFNTSCTKVSNAQAQTIENFVKAYFPEAEVLSTIRDGFDYEVTLSDYTHIEFDSNALGKTPEWDEIDCRRSTIYKVVPAALVPPAPNPVHRENHEGQSRLGHRAWQRRRNRVRPQIQRHRI